MFSTAETGQVPWLSSATGEDTFPAMELSLDIDYVLGQMEKSTRDRKLKKEWTLSEYMMHITSIPNASEVQLPLREPQNDSAPPLLLYDQYGITRRFRLNGVDTLRTIPPFDLLADDNIIYEDMSEEETPEPQTPPSLLAMGLPQDFQAFGAVASCSTRSQYSELEEAESRYRASSEEGDRYTSSSSDSERQSSPSSYSPSENGSDPETVHTQSRNPSPAADMSKWFEAASKIIAPHEPSPPRAMLPIQWPHDERAMHDVVFGVEGYWPPIQADAPAPQAKSPSPLPSLTPSPPPPPTHMKTLGKRASPEAPEAPNKRPRRKNSKSDKKAGPSTIPYDPPSPPSDSGSDYAFPSPPRARPRARPRRKAPPRARNTRKTKSCSGNRRFKCIFKDCTQAAFGAPKDRNRHMDTHFKCRFPCFPCKKWFPREDALKRHAKKPECLESYIMRSCDQVCEPYWRTCDLDWLVCPPPNDPLFDWFIERVREEIGEEAARMLLEEEEE